MTKTIAITALVILGLSSATYADDTAESAGNLVKADGGVFKETFVNPDVDVSQFTKIMFAEGTFEFREVKKTHRMSSSMSSGKSEFWISESDREKAQIMISDVFDSEIANIKNFEIVDEAGPGVLVLHGGLYDIVSHIPPEMIGSGSTYVRSVATVTIALEAWDSVTGEVVFNTSERSKIEPRGQGGIDANSVMIRAEVRRWARRAAAKMVKGLDGLRQ
jgi:hypothetical protein